MTDFISCALPENAEVLIRHSEIVAVMEYEEEELIFSKILLKNGVEIIVEDTVADIGKLIEEAMED